MSETRPDEPSPEGEPSSGEDTLAALNAPGFVDHSGSPNETVSNPADPDDSASNADTPTS